MNQPSTKNSYENVLTQIELLKQQNGQLNDSKSLDLLINTIKLLNMNNGDDFRYNERLKERMGEDGMIVIEILITIISLKLLNDDQILSIDTLNELLDEIQFSVCSLDSNNETFLDNINSQLLLYNSEITNEQIVQVNEQIHMEEKIIMYENEQSEEIKQNYSVENDNKEKKKVSAMDRIRTNLEKEYNEKKQNKLSLLSEESQFNLQQQEAKLYTKVKNKAYNHYIDDRKYEGIYSGQMSDGKPNGFGTFTSNPQQQSKNLGGSFCYKGPWLCGKFDGEFGEFSSKVVKLIGSWKDNKMHGYGYQFFQDGCLLYEGQWENGFKLGSGIVYDLHEDIAFEGFLQKGRSCCFHHLMDTQEIQEYQRMFFGNPKQCACYEVKRK